MIGRSALALAALLSVAATGRPGYHPSTLLKIYLYGRVGGSNGKRSAIPS